MSTNFVKYWLIEMINVYKPGNYDKESSQFQTEIGVRQSVEIYPNFHGNVARHLLPESSRRIKLV